MWPAVQRAWRLTTLMALFVSVGCQGELAAGPAGPAGSDDEGTCRRADCDEPSPASRAPRLSHPQWENATRDLLALDAPSGLSSTFLNDSRRGLFDNAGADLSVGEPLWAGYQSAAESLASRIAGDPAALARILPASLPTDGTRSRVFIEGFGQRVFRRPLTATEVDTYVTLFGRAAGFYPEHDAFTAGVRLMIEAMFQSPHFIYRVELSTTRDGEVIRLTDWELASRLSFALWNTTPDDQLLRAAAAGELSTLDGLRLEAKRLLEDPRAREMVGLFHAELLETNNYTDVRRSTTLFPEFNDTLGGSMQRETAAFVESVVFTDRGGFADLLTAPYTFVDSDLARVYGLSGTFGSEMTRVDLDPAQRSGLLTQIGFLAVNATDTETDPIHRGVFVNKRILCAPLPSPPAVVPALPPDDPMMPLPMRQRITRHTGAGTCGATCHGTLINPIGFAYEHYDALGRWRDTDRMQPVDASASYQFGRQNLAYDGAVELGRTMASQVFAHQCYVQHWVEYLHGREVGGNDGPGIVRIGADSLERDLPIEEVILTIVSSNAFRTRATTEYDREGVEAMP